MPLAAYLSGSRSGSFFFMQFRMTCPGSGVAHSVLGPPVTVSNGDNPSQTSPQTSLIKTLFAGDLLCQADS